MVVSILVLEEALWVESFSVDKEFEFIDNVLNILMISLIWNSCSVERLGSGIIQNDIN